MEEQFWSLLSVINKAPIFGEQPAQERQSRALLLTKLTALPQEIERIPDSPERIFEAFDVGRRKSELLQGRLDALTKRERVAQPEADALTAELEAMRLREMSAEERKGVLKDRRQPLAEGGR